MLTLFRRHLKSCKHRSRRFRGCTCPISVEGTLRGKKIRKSLEVRNWDSAQKVVRDWEAEGEAAMVFVAEACDKFVLDAEARNVGPAQMGKYRLLGREMKAYFSGQFIRGIGVEDLSSFRGTWKLSPVSSGKKLERLRAFFKFCMEREWVNSNPAKILKVPKVKPNPTLPFSQSEWEKILWATEVYPNRPPGRRREVKAFILLLRYSGLRIGDAVSLETKRIEYGKLLLYTAKTGTAVWLPLPELVTNALSFLPPGDRFFWSGLGTLKSATTVWQRSVQKLLKLAGVKGHAHMFRDTLAVDLLSKGVSLENVAAILGNTVRIAEKHYAPFVQSRQIELEKAVKLTWQSAL